jgi:hypothetical protein
MDADDAEVIAQLNDPVERARQATERLAYHQGQTTKLARLRREAIAELRASGLSYAKVADALGVSRARVAQLRGAGHVIEQDFFGGEVVTITMPLRAGADRPYVAQEDFEAAAQLARYLNSVDIETSFGQVDPSGDIDFSPPGMVLICGPKSSKVARTVIDSDPLMAFTPTKDGRWQVVDRTTGEAFTSPMDQAQPEHGDIAYVARLARPNSDRDVLVIAGVHAVGSLGAVHYLTQPANVHQLHRAVGARRFSMVVGCEFTDAPLRVQRSEAISPARGHPGDD